MSEFLKEENLKDFLKILEHIIKKQIISELERSIGRGQRSNEI